jgi:hypothetical protein
MRVAVAQIELKLGQTSQIVDAYGERLVVEAGETEEALPTAEVEFENARVKDYIVPGKYELHPFDDRRPELYGALVEQATQVVEA